MTKTYRHKSCGMVHTPVLLRETIALLDPKLGETFADATVGSGGHAAAIAERIGKSGILLCLDWDKEAVARARRLLAPHPAKKIIVHANYTETPRIMRSEKLDRLDGLVADLGLSSFQLAASDRGFSFAAMGPLDMRYDAADDTLSTAADIVNGLSERELADLIFRCGEEPAARRIAHAIMESRRRRRIETAADLARVIERVAPRRGRTHPATKTFMALRIAVNRELENVESLIAALPAVIAPGGRVAIITFHSLEDRIVKNAFRELARQEKAVLLSKKPVVPARKEIIENPRSRSAKLRAVRFIS